MLIAALMSVLVEAIDRHGRDPPDGLAAASEQDKDAPASSIGRTLDALQAYGPDAVPVVSHRAAQSSFHWPAAGAGK